MNKSQSAICTLLDANKIDSFPKSLAAKLDSVATFQDSLAVLKEAKAQYFKQDF